MANRIVSGDPEIRLSIRFDRKARRQAKGGKNIVHVFIMKLF